MDLVRGSADRYLRVLHIPVGKAEGSFYLCQLSLKPEPGNAISSYDYTPNAMHLEYQQVLGLGESLDSFQVPTRHK